MRRLQRAPAAPAGWQALVEEAFADHSAFVKAAKRFERLDLNCPVRRAGFSTYAVAKRVACFRGKAEFKALWGQAKDTLTALCHDKCSYCEGEINARRAAQVDHFQPKALFPTQTYQWSNYFVACGGCNGAKSDKWPVRSGYVRPDSAAAEKAFRFEKDGTVTAARGGAAKEMLRDFDLDRKPLVRRRALHIRNAIGPLNDLRALPASMAKRLVKSHLQRISAPEMVYSVALRQCVSREWQTLRGQ